MVRRHNEIHFVLLLVAPIVDGFALEVGRQFIQHQMFPERQHGADDLPAPGQVLPVVVQVDADEVSIQTSDKGIRLRGIDAKLIDEILANSQKT